jgi:hypothetical protein
MYMQEQSFIQELDSGISMSLRYTHQPLRFRLEVARRKRCRFRLESIRAVRISIAVCVAVGCAIGVSISCAIRVSIRLRVAIGMPVRTSAVVLFGVCGAVAHGGPAFHPGHIHLGGMALVALAADRGHEVDEKAQDVEEVDEGNGPLQTGRCIVLSLLAGNAEANCQANLDQDEGKLDPEAYPQHAVLAKMDAQALVLPADEDGADDVADNEDGEEDVVEAVVVYAVEDGKKDEACGAGDGGGDTDTAVDFLPDGGVGGEFARVSEPALEDEGDVE